MERFGGLGFDGVSTVRKKRSNTSRCPRSDSLLFFEGREPSTLSSTPPSDNVGKASSDDNVGYDTSSRRKELNLNKPSSRGLSFNRAEGETSSKKIRNEQGRNAADLKRCSEGVLAPANWKNTNKVELQSRTPDSYIDNGRNDNSRDLGQSRTRSNGSGNRGESSLHENKLRKVKLKVGGVTRTIHANTTSDGSNSASSVKPSHSTGVPRKRQKLILQDNSDDDQSLPGQANGLQGIPWKDFSGGNFPLVPTENLRSKISEENLSAKQTDKSNSIYSSEATRKSKRVPKRRVLDGTFDDANADDEIQYLERLKAAKFGKDYDDDEEEDGKKRNFLKASKTRVDGGKYDEVVEGYGLSRKFKEGNKKLRLDRDSEDTNYVESVDSFADGKKEFSLTTRQRALQSAKDVSAGTNSSLIEFPNGLPPAPPRKQKEKLSEVEQQLKKAEAAQRRRLQVEKAARESEAEAIRKIRGIDSSGNKREDKLRKRLDELAREKAATAKALASTTVRWVMGPTGTFVTFPKLPSIFDSNHCSYPPPREKCAGPLCTNAYKYRDSKSKLPLCSLQCYRAIHEMMQPVTTC